MREERERETEGKKKHTLVTPRGRRTCLRLQLRPLFKAAKDYRMRVAVWVLQAFDIVREFPDRVWKLSELVRNPLNLRLGR